METGELLTRWTIRGSLAFYVLGLALRIRAYRRLRWLSVARLAWTAGWLAYVLHVVCAFAFFHNWSHSAAYAATAQRTAEVTGLNWGGGLYANYAFSLVWLVDVCWWWRGLEVYEGRPRWVEGTVQGFLGFIAFNATVVFGAGLARWLGLAACVLLGTLVGIRFFRPRR